MTTCLMLRDKSQRQTDRNRQEVPTYVNRFILLQRLSSLPTVPSPSCFKRFCWVFREETADVLTSFLPIFAQPFGTLCRNDSWDLTENCFPHVCNVRTKKTCMKRAQTILNQCCVHMKQNRGCFVPWLPSKDTSLRAGNFLFPVKG